MKRIIPIAGTRGWHYLKQLLDRFNKDQCAVFAASLSFFGLLSIIPVLLVALATLGYLLHDPHQARMQIEHVVQGMLPGRAAREAIHYLMDEFQVESQIAVLIRARGLAAAIGLLSLVWAAMQIFVNGATAMNAVWEVPETRGWLKLRLVALGLLIGAGSLFLLSLLPSSGPDLVRRLHIPRLGLPEHVPWYIDLLFTLIAVAINAAMFALIYRFLPAAEVSWKQAAVGGVLMGVLWELAKQGFSIYMARFGARNPMYGGLGGVMILVIWIYYTSMLLLLGAEVAKLYQDVEARKQERAPAPARSEQRGRGSASRGGASWSR